MIQNHGNRIIVVLITILLLFTAGCSEDDTYYKLAGDWEGQNVNTATGQKWTLKILFDHRGSEISGYYSDYRGNLTLRNITYDGETIGFLIDLWPETVTFFGNLSNDSSMDGSWSYSGDGNNGEWYLLKDRDPDNEEEEEEEPESSTANPFSG